MIAMENQEIMSNFLFEAWSLQESIRRDEGFFAFDESSFLTII